MKKITAKLIQAGGIEIKVSPTELKHEGETLYKTDRNYYTVNDGIATIFEKIPKEKDSLSKTLSWSERFTRLRNHFSLTYKDIAKLLDCSDGSLRAMVSSKTQEMGIGFKFAIIIFELCTGLSKQEELYPTVLEDRNPYKDEFKAL
ncbi:hypothetical protein VB796_08625 [Arcicella sp. LKC2W]|uniref:hypothetical protein n=1 Tax=Arcicella sp. LKC2W TaxID=2984198 RepID=UPI002B1F742B|nr:hypothetical protein [Arcicella sp. LKC2W]MEA5459098.1 hypothetical protein [Arcicella sp. LKC2W]